MIGTYDLYLFEEVRSKKSPSFFHRTSGLGCPFGGEHFNIVSCPTETSVSLGKIRKSSRISVKQKIVNNKKNPITLHHHSSEIISLSLKKMS